MEDKIVTIKDIAAVLNTSIGTVDRALHNRKGISSETRKKILKKADEMGYKVNKVAQSLSRKELVFGCLFPSENFSYFYGEIEEGIRAAAEKLKDYKIKVILKKLETLDYQKEIEILDELTLEGIDALAICPAHTEFVNDKINQLIALGKPVVTIATDAPKSNRVTCVATDSFNNGQIVGGLMELFVPENSKVAVITGFKSISDHQEKTSGFSDVILNSSKNIEIVGVYESFEIPEIVYEKVKEVISKHDIQGIYFNSANSWAGCQAIEELGKEKDICVISTDLSPKQVKYIENGLIKASIHQNPFLQGYNALNILFDILSENKKYPQNSYTRPDIITKYNLRYFLENKDI